MHWRIPWNLCGVSASAIESPPVDIVDRNHAHVKCLTRCRVPTGGALLLCSSCFFAAGFGDESPPDDMVRATNLHSCYSGCWVTSKRVKLRGIVAGAL
jgi:hypothetical protein